MDPVKPDSGNPSPFSKMLGIISKNKQNKSTNITVPVSKADEYYKMTHRKRGYAVILNHVSFDPKLKKVEKFEDRFPGAYRDRQLLEETFHSLGFKVIVHEPEKLTVERVRAAIDKITSKDFSDRDCLVIVVSSHGKVDRVCAYDTWYHVDMITEKLMPKRCPSLAGKPKIIILNVCQGNKFDRGLTVQVDGDDRNKNLIQTDGGNPLQTYRMPSHADFLFAYSTVKDYVSFRDDEGSWYIRQLCEIFNEKASDTDILTMLTYVHRQMAVNWEGEGDYAKMKQMPCVTHTLTRLLILCPK